MHAAPDCKATRRDGAPCRSKARKGGSLCHRHGGGWKVERTGPNKGKPKISQWVKGAGIIGESGAAILRNQPPGLETVPEWAELTRVKAKRRMIAMAVAFQAYQVTGDALAWDQARADIIAGHRAAVAREARTMARRYAEREALGIPHPADPAKW